MANLLQNGDFSQSTGVGASSVAGPGWETDYLVPSGGCLFQGAGAGQARWEFFTTNAAQVTCGQFGGIPALGGRSMGVNVGLLGQDIIRWRNIHLKNGARYRLSVDAAVMFFPYSVGIAIDNVIIVPLNAPPAASVWTTTATEFTWAGTTGLHTVSLRTNSAQAGGNDHCFDNFVLERVVDGFFPPCCLRAPICYTLPSSPAIVRRGVVDLGELPARYYDVATGSELAAGTFTPVACVQRRDE